MNAALHAQLLQEPVPTQDGQPARCGVTLVGQGKDHAWQLEWLVGLAKRPWGPTFSTVKAACAASAAVNAHIEESQS